MSNLEKCTRHTTLNQEKAAGCRFKEANYKRARKQTGIWKSEKILHSVLWEHYSGAVAREAEYYG